MVKLSGTVVLDKGGQNSKGRMRNFVINPYFTVLHRSTQYKQVELFTYKICTYRKDLEWV